MVSPLESERVRELLERAGLGGLHPRTLRAVLALAVVLVSAAAWRFWPAAPKPEIPLDEESAEQPASDESVAAPVEIVVHVAGAVMRPGVYRLPVGSRVDDAIASAGGGVGNSALDALNRARILADGEQVYVPTVEEAQSGGGEAGLPQTSGRATEGKVDINRASAQELEELPGIGPATAQKIVDDREANGPFAKPEDLMRVPGIGAKKFEAMREFVVCG